MNGPCGNFTEDSSNEHCIYFELLSMDLVFTDDSNILTTSTVFTGDFLSMDLVFTEDSHNEHSVH